MNLGSVPAHTLVGKLAVDLVIKIQLDVRRHRLAQIWISRLKHQALKRDVPDGPGLDAVHGERLHDRRSVVMFVFENRSGSAVIMALK